MLSTTLSPLVEKLSNFLSAHPAAPVLVALDGRCGSGKTTLAAQPVSYTHLTLPTT